MSSNWNSVAVLLRTPSLQLSFFLHSEQGARWAVKYWTGVICLASMGLTSRRASLLSTFLG